MKYVPECGACIFHWVYERTAPRFQEGERPRLALAIEEAIGGDPAETANLGSLCNRAVFAAIEAGADMSVFYEAFKERSNAQAAALLPRATAHIEAGKTERERIERACVLAAAGNVAPLTAPTEAFTFPEVMTFLEGSDRAVFAGDPYDAILRARRILYITDNAGEVGFDSLLLKAIKKGGAHVTLVVKRATYFEDVTMSDARFFHLHEVVDEITETAGFAVPDEMDPVLGRAYEEADLIVAKGTGSYEALRDETAGKKAIFLLKVKCGPISRETEVEEGRVLVKVDG